MKEAKIDVHYRNGDDHRDRLCANCTMFVPPHDCTSVKGTISPDALCDLYERKQDDRRSVASQH